MPKRAFRRGRGSDRWRRRARARPRPRSRRRTGRRCCRRRRARSSSQPPLELLPHRSDLVARIVVLRLVLDGERTGVADSLERTEARLDVDDPAAPGTRLVWLALVQDVLQMNVADVGAELL